MKPNFALLSTVPIVALTLSGCQGGQPDEMSAPAASAPAEVIPLEDVKKSQHGSVSQTIANTEISIVYNRPVARGRELYGGIVPFGEIWNPGADEATAIAISRDVLIDGNPLPAGRYSIWAIPDMQEWTLILSRAHDVYHTPYPDGQDALRVSLAPQVGSHMETLVFYFSVVEGKDAVLNLHWGETVVPIPIQVE